MFYSDWRLTDVKLAKGNLAPRTRLTLRGSLANQGDGTSSNATVALYLTRTGPRILLNETSEPPMRPGEESEFSIEGTVPAGISPCDIQSQFVVNPERGTSE